MDGTLEQFGWAADTWLQPWGDFIATRLDTRTQPCSGSILKGKEHPLVKCRGRRMAVIGMGRTVG